MMQARAMQQTDSGDASPPGSQLGTPTAKAQLARRTDSGEVSLYIFNELLVPPLQQWSSVRSADAKLRAV